VDLWRQEAGGCAQLDLVKLVAASAWPVGRWGGELGGGGGTGRCGLVPAARRRRQGAGQRRLEHAGGGSAAAK
jgi:hypothetical protein